MQKHFAVVTGIAMLAVAGVIVSQQGGVFSGSMRGQMVPSGTTGSSNCPPGHLLCGIATCCNGATQTCNGNGGCAWKPGSEPAPQTPPGPASSSSSYSNPAKSCGIPGQSCDPACNSPFVCTAVGNEYCMCDMPPAPPAPPPRPPSTKCGDQEAPYCSAGKCGTNGVCTYNELNNLCWCVYAPPSSSSSSRR